MFQHCFQMTLIVKAKNYIPQKSRGSSILFWSTIETLLIIILYYFFIYIYIGHLQSVFRLWHPTSMLLQKMDAREAVYLQKHKAGFRHLRLKYIIIPYGCKTDRRCEREEWVSVFLEYHQLYGHISMTKCRTAITPLQTHLSYCSLALSRRYIYRYTRYNATPGLVSYLRLPAMNFVMHFFTFGI